MRRRNSRSAHLRRLRRRHLPEMRYPAGSRGRPGHGVIICLLLAVHVVIPCNARMTTPSLVAPSEAKLTWLNFCVCTAYLDRLHARSAGFSNPGREVVCLGLAGTSVPRFRIASRLVLAAFGACDDGSGADCPIPKCSPVYS